MWPPEPFRLNQAVAGTYYNRDTSGQGNLVDIDPVTRFVFMAWFTWASGPEAGAISPDAIGDTNHRWLTASGTHGYRDTFVEMDVYNSTGGAFNDPKAVTTAKTGTAVLEMDGCDSGELRYTLDSGEEGVIPMVRLLTGRVAECEEEYEGPDVLYKR